MQIEIAAGGQILAVIHHDGRITYPTGQPPDEAARSFWRALATQNPMMQLVALLHECNIMLEQETKRLSNEALGSDDPHRWVVETRLMGVNELRERIAVALRS